MDRLLTRLGDSPRGRVAVVLTLWAVAVLLGVIAAA